MRKDLWKDSTRSACDPCKAESKDAAGCEELYRAGDDRYDYLGGSASATDQTGLIPAAPQNADEAASYTDVYPVYPPPLLKAEEDPAD